MYVLDVAGVPDLRSIPYAAFQGDGKTVAALLGGHVDVASVTVGASINFLEAKKIRSLAITSEKRLGGPVMKDVATAKEQGVNAVWANWRGIFGPPDMPEHAVKYIQDALTKMVKTKAWQEALEKRQWTNSLDTANFNRFLERQYENSKTILNKLGLLKK